MTDINYPEINGCRYDFSSIECDANGVVLKGYEGISYSDKCEPGEARGTHQQALGDTPGEYSAEGSLEMFKLEHQALIESLGNGYMRRKFNIMVSYGNDGDPLLTDELLGCRIKSGEDGHQKGSDPLKVKVGLWIRLIRRNGVDPIPDALG